LKIVVHDYAGHPFQVDLSRELARRGHSVVHVYFRGDPGPKGQLQRRADDPEALRFEGVDLKHAYNKASFLRRRFDDVEYGKRAGALIEREKPDLVISGNTPTEAQQKIINASARADAAFVFWVQDFYSIAVSQLLARKLGFLGGAVGAYYRMLERSQLRRAQAVVVITDSMSKLAAKWATSEEKVFSIENWGALGDIQPSEKRNPWSTRHGLADSFNFLYSGTLGLKHNPQLLIELARQYAGRARVVVISQGLNVDALEEARSRLGLDNLVILPLQPFNELPDVLATADVAVAMIEPDASTFSVPSKVQSYLCASRAILLAAPKDNLASVVVRKVNAGQVAEPDDSMSFLKAAERLYADAPYRAAAAANGRSYAVQTYDIGKVADKFERVFKFASRPGAPETHWRTVNASSKLE
jgi:colanic acid biosynthesis glycosyl transferase WcaI